MKQELRSPSNDRELERLFQTWIFFGLLRKILVPHGLYNTRDFLEQDDRGQHVSTAKLLERLVAWQAVDRSWTDTENVALYDQSVPCLQLAENALKILYSLPQASLTKEWCHPEISRAIAL